MNETAAVLCESGGIGMMDELWAARRAAVAGVYAAAELHMLTDTSDDYKVKCHALHVTRHTSHVTRHTSHVARHTSHVTRHTSHVTRHRIHATSYCVVCKSYTTQGRSCGRRVTSPCSHSARCSPPHHSPLPLLCLTPLHRHHRTSVSTRYHLPVRSNIT